MPAVTCTLRRHLQLFPFRHQIENEMFSYGKVLILLLFIAPQGRYLFGNRQHTQTLRALTSRFTLTAKECGQQTIHHSYTYAPHGKNVWVGHRKRRFLYRWINGHILQATKYSATTSCIAVVMFSYGWQMLEKYLPFYDPTLAKRKFLLLVIESERIGY